MLLLGTEANKHLICSVMTCISLTVHCR